LSVISAVYTEQKKFVIVVVEEESVEVVPRSRILEA